MKLTTGTIGLPTIGRDFDEVFGTLLNTPLPFPIFDLEPFTKAMEGTWTPKIDLVENEKEFILRAEVPDVPRENLDVNLEGNVVTLTGHREKKVREAGETYLWQEREAGKFVRTIRLPKAVEANKVEAVYHDGMLTVHLPKVETAVKNRILIKA
jgi:HSP20 family protein